MCNVRGKAKEGATVTKMHLSFGAPLASVFIQPPHSQAGETKFVSAHSIIYSESEVT